MTPEELARKLESIKGLAGSGTVLAEAIKVFSDIVRTMEPGDIAGQDKVSAAPIAYDLWYLTYHKNLLKKYYENTGADFGHYKYAPYLASNFSFLNYLPGLKPLKVLTDLEQLIKNKKEFVSVWDETAEYQNNGIYWINTAFFELRPKDKQLKYPSDGSKGFKASPNDYVGYIAFPIGQLGVMEVVSLFQETDLNGYPFSAYSSNSVYYAKPAYGPLKTEDTPTAQTGDMFPAMKDKDGNQLAGMNYCFGRHLIESAYYKPEIPALQQNEDNKQCNLVADRDVELWASDIKDYGEDVKPKKWMRMWIRKNNTFPVPGEFMGILVRPVAAPPHVWWFQESTPLLYAGNWIETSNFTSGIVTEVTLEANRTDNGVGDLYKVSVQGCVIQVTATDFFRYAVGDRVGILKYQSITTVYVNAFNSNNQTHLKESDGFAKTSVINTNYIIVPVTFYKIKH